MWLKLWLPVIVNRYSVQRSPVQKRVLQECMFHLDLTCCILIWKIFGSPDQLHPLKYDLHVMIHCQLSADLSLIKYYIRQLLPLYNLHSTKIDPKWTIFSLLRPLQTPQPTSSTLQPPTLQSPPSPIPSPLSSTTFSPKQNAMSSSGSQKHRPYLPMTLLQHQHGHAR